MKANERERGRQDPRKMVHPEINLMVKAIRVKRSAAIWQANATRVPDVASMKRTPMSAVARLAAYGATEPTQLTPRQSRRFWHKRNRAVGRAGV